MLMNALISPVEMAFCHQANFEMAENTKHGNYNY